MGFPIKHEEYHDTRQDIDIYIYIYDDYNLIHSDISDINILIEIPYIIHNNISKVEVPWKKF